MLSLGCLSLSPRGMRSPSYYQYLQYLVLCLRTYDKVPGRCSATQSRTWLDVALDSLDDVFFFPLTGPTETEEAKP